MSSNMAFIYEPHFKTSKFRVAVADQQCETNYIVVTCSPRYNGIWKWTKTLGKKYETWYNNGLVCYCIPIDECIKTQELNSIQNPEIRAKVKKLQSKWYKSEVRNRDYEYKNKPEWMID